MTIYTYDSVYSNDFSDEAWEVGSVDDVSGFDCVAVAQTETLAQRIVEMLSTPEPQPTRAAKWISTGEGEGDLFFVMIDTEMNVPDLEGPYHALKDAQDAAETINHDTEIWKLVPVLEPVASVNADAAAWGSFYDTDPAVRRVAVLEGLLTTYGVCEITGALIKALEQLADNPEGFESQEDYLREARRRLLEALSK